MVHFERNDVIIVILKFKSHLQFFDINIFRKVIIVTKLLFKSYRDIIQDKVFIQYSSFP